jgi:type I restriction enzyme, S subunit
MTLPPYPAYSDTGMPWIPRLPESWRLLHLNALCRQISTGPFGTALGSDDYISGGIPVINPSHIQNGHCVPDPDTSVSVETAKRLDIWRLRAGDLVVARRGELGRSAIVLPSQSGWICGTGSLRLTSEPSRSCSRYLQAVMEAAHTREWLNLASVGSTMPNISEAIIGRLPVAVPASLEDQFAIADFLERERGKIDALMAEQTQLIAFLKEKRQAVISQAVTKGLDPNAPMKESGIE